MSDAVVVAYLRGRAAEIDELVEACVWKHSVRKTIFVACSKTLKSAAKEVEQGRHLGQGGEL